MTTQDNNLSEIENVGITERGIRSLVGSALIATVLLSPSLSETTLATLSMLSIYIVFTAITGWDPIHALIRKSRRQQTPVPPTATVRPRSDAKRVTDTHKKAA